jgi:hypothetical protein
MSQAYSRKSLFKWLAKSISSIVAWLLDAAVIIVAKKIVK